MAALLTMADSRQPGLDRDLVARCLAGETDPFRQLVRRYERLVIAHLRTRLRDTSALEDAAQETFLRAYRNLAGLRSPDAFYSWLLGIADRVARESVRHMARAREVLEAYAAEPARRVEPPAAAASRDLELESALASLTEPLRQVVLLRFYAGRSCAEIAAELRIPVSTVTKRLSRAYDHLRRRIDR